MKTQASLVRADCAVHLYAETAIYVNFALVILPGNTESDDALSFHHALQNFRVFKLRIFFQNRHNRRQNFFDGIVEFRLVGIAFFN